MASTIGDDDDIEKAWRQIVEEFSRIAGVDISEPEIGSDKLELKVSGGAASAGKTKSSDVIKKTFDCVMDLAKIASDGASLVYPPTGVCFEVARYLMDTVSTYRRAFTVPGLKKTIEKLKPDLEGVRDTLDIEKYGGRLPRRLRSGIIQILSEFVTIGKICARAVRDSGSVTGVAKNVAKALVRYDGNLSAHVGNIGKFTKQVRNFKSDDVWKFVTLTRSEAEQDKKRERIMESLDVNGIVSTQPWTAAHREYRARFKRGTGAWLRSRDDFRAWIDVHKTNCKQPVLLLTAPGGYGKSCLVSDVVDFLGCNQLSSQPSPPVSIGYFYFGAPMTAVASNAKQQQRPSLGDALLAVIWQYAESDAAFQSFVSKRLRQVSSSSVDLWQRFIKGFHTQKVSNKKILFIILDGVDQCRHDSSSETPANNLRHIIKTLSTFTRPGLDIRLLLSCKDGFFDGPEIPHNEMVATMAITDHNDTDFRTMVKTKMDDICGSLKSDGKMTYWREACEKEIALRIDGNFVELNGLFNKIKRGATQSEVIDMMSKILDGSSFMEYQLEMMEKTLSESQIDDLNEILSWTVCMYRCPTIDDIHHILRRKSGKRTDLPLDQVQRLYGSILQFEDDNLLVSSDAMDYFEKLEVRRLNVIAFDQLPFRDVEDLTGEESDALIPHSEILIVQELIKNICGTEVFDKFGFESHFGRLRSEKPSKPLRRIQCNVANAHSVIISVCFKSILAPEENVEHSQSLDNYIARYLFRHMKEMHLNRLEEAHQKVVFSNLAKFLNQELAAKRWLNTI